jgi:hypothetical protein
MTSKNTYKKKDSNTKKHKQILHKDKLDLKGIKGKMYFIGYDDGYKQAKEDEKEKYGKFIDELNTIAFAIQRELGK